MFCSTRCCQSASTASTFDFEYAGKPVRYQYHISGNGFSPDRVIINGTEIESARHAENTYRAGGMLIPKREFILDLESAVKLSRYILEDA